MKAIVYHQYGSPDILQLEEREKPTPGDNEVLLKVHAASVNPYDWHFLRGMPYLLRLAAGLPKPKDPRLGADVAGVVEAIGRNVTRFQLGDAVFGTCKGAFAEYACTPELSLVARPANLTFEQAAAVPIAGISALQGLRDAGQIHPGKKVLINGAAGGVGTFAVQIAKSFGAEVTGVCSTRNVDMVRSLGADQVIDYTQADFTTGSQCCDLILDCVGNHSVAAIRRVMNPQGRDVPFGGDGGRWMVSALTRSLTAMVLSQFGGRRLVPFFLAKLSQESLDALRELLESGKVVPVIDRRYKLAETPDAIRYLEEGHARGKVVVIVG